MTTNLWEHKTQGVNYDLYRPTYPSTLTDKVLYGSDGRQLYLDVATGTGQLLFNLYCHFTRALGVDLSSQMVQVSSAKANHINEYLNSEGKIRVFQKDCLKIHELISNDEQFDLITVGEALHWFPIDQFLAYLKYRLLKPNGTFGVFGYYISRCYFLYGPESEKPEANDIYYEYYDTIEPYFAFRMKELDECYTEPKYTFANHFKKVNREVTSCRMDMTAENFVNFFKTYSGYNTYLKQTGRDVAEYMRQKVNGRSVGMWVKYFLIKCYEPLQS